MSTTKLVSSTGYKILVGFEVIVEKPPKTNKQKNPIKKPHEILLSVKKAYVPNQLSCTVLLKHRNREKS